MESVCTTHRCLIREKQPHRPCLGCVPNCLYGSVNPTEEEGRHQETVAASTVMPKNGKDFLSIDANKTHLFALLPRVILAHILLNCDNVYLCTYNYLCFIFHIFYTVVFHVA